MKILTSSLLAFLIFSISLFGQNAEMDKAAAEFYNSGNKSLKAGDFQGALTSYDEALKTSQDYRIYYQRGITMKKMRKYEDAIASFKKAVEVNPQFDIAYNGLGSTYFITGEYQAAVDAFKKFAELTPKESLKNTANEYVSRAYAKLGESEKADGNYEKAIGFWQESVNYYDYDAAYLFLAEAFCETGKYTEALEAADKALNHRKKITKGGPLYYKGIAFKNMGEDAKAKEAFEAGKKDQKYAKLCEYELKNYNL
jgi:tetratricopeptide (TPR) repeat protein